MIILLLGITLEIMCITGGAILMYFGQTTTCYPASFMGGVLMGKAGAEIVQKIGYYRENK